MRVVGQLLGLVMLCGRAADLIPVSAAIQAVGRLGRSGRITRELSRVRCPVCQQPYGWQAAADRRAVGKAGPPLSVQDPTPSRGWIVVCGRCGEALAVSAFSLVRRFRWPGPGHSRGGT